MTITRAEAIEKLEQYREFSREMERNWASVDWEDRPDHLVDPRELAHNHRVYADALDMAIDALREQKQERWVSIKERLPTKEDAGENGSILVIRMDDGDVKRLSWDIVVRYPSEFAYWMTMPELPKEG